MSLLALSTLTLKVLGDRREVAGIQAATARDSGEAVAMLTLSGAGRFLCDVPVSDPGYTLAPDGQGRYRWWVDNTTIATGRVDVVVDGVAPLFGGRREVASTLGFRWSADEPRVA